MVSKSIKINAEDYDLLQQTEGHSIVERIHNLVVNKVVNVVVNPNNSVVIPKNEVVNVSPSAIETANKEQNNPIDNERHQRELKGLLDFKIGELTANIEEKFKRNGLFK